KLPNTTDRDESSADQRPSGRLGCGRFHRNVVKQELCRDVISAERNRIVPGAHLRRHELCVGERIRRRPRDVENKRIVPKHLKISDRIERRISRRDLGQGFLRGAGKERFYEEAKCVRLPVYRVQRLRKRIVVARCKTRKEHGVLTTV